MCNVYRVNCGKVRTKANPRVSLPLIELFCVLILPGLPKKMVHMATFGFTGRVRNGFGCFTNLFKDQGFFYILHLYNSTTDQNITLLLCHSSECFHPQPRGLFRSFICAPPHQHPVQRKKIPRGEAKAKKQVKAGVGLEPTTFRL